MKTRNNIALVAGLLALAAAPTVYSQLSATVEPGYSFESGEYITLSKLNAGFNPTVYVEGTVTGSSLGANSVTPANLTTNIFDQVTITGGNGAVAVVNYDNQTLGELTNKLSVLEDGITAFYLADDSVTSDQVTTNAIGSEWMVDTNVITSYHLRTNWVSEWINDTNSIYGTNSPVLTNGPASGDYIVVHDVSNDTNMALVEVGSIFAPVFVSSDIAFTNSTPTTYEVAHGLGRAPYFVAVVAVCNTAEYGYAIGDEIPLPNYSEIDGDFVNAGANIFYDSTTVGYRTTGDWGVPRIARLNANSEANLTAGSWDIRFRAW